MKRISYLFIASTLLLGACTGGFKKGEAKTEYKIVSGSGNQKLEYGNFVEISYKYQVKDTVIQSSDDNGKQVFVLDSIGIPLKFFSVFKQAKVGDSIIIRMTADSFFRNNMPTFAKKEQMVYSMFRVTNAFKTKEQADSAMAINRKFAEEVQMRKYLEQAKKDSLEAIPQLKKDTKTIEDYLAKNNIKAVQGKMGTFVEIITPGTGPLLDTGVVIKVNYTGKTFSGTVFDSNTDPSFQHVDPYSVEIPADINTANVVKGWIDGLKLLSKGSKAKFYIPSALAWGKKGSGEKIKPNDNVIFDIEIVNVQTREEAMKEAMEQQKKQQEAMQKMQNAKPEAPKK